MTLPNGTRVHVAHSTPRHELATIIAQDDARAVVATPKPCAYCGTGPCTGSPRTANGADVGRWYRIHPETGIPSRWRKTTHPLADITAAEEH